MQVFRINPTKSYSYGVALVAARDTDEAIKIFTETEFRNWEYDEFQCTINIIVGLDYNTKEPTLILDTLTSEYPSQQSSPSFSINFGISPLNELCSLNPYLLKL